MLSGLAFLRFQVLGQHGGGEVAGGAAAAAAEGTHLLQVVGESASDVPCLCCPVSLARMLPSCPAPLPAWAQENSQGWH